MSNDTYIPFSQIVAELKAICEAGKTGVMYITSIDNRSAQLMIDDGEIVFLYFFNRRGREALKLMAEVETGRFRFQEGSSSSLRVDLPDTEDILRYLSAASGLDPVASATVGPVTMPDTGAAQPARGILALTVEQKETLEACLANFIGPMAALICEDHLNSVQDVSTAIERLAAEIPISSQAESFRREMADRFGV